METKQTAVEWLQQELFQRYNFIDDEFIFHQAKAIEKEQIKATAIKCHFEGVRQSAKTSEDYIAYGEQYYNETYRN